MVLPSFILIPLYIYPVAQTGGTAANPTYSPTWTFLFNTIKAYPNIDFNIVVNPNNGPGTLDSNGCPTDLNYLAGISNLTAFDNTNVLGYVPTGWQANPPLARAISGVENDIATWNNYSHCRTHDTHVDGIFFDEAPTVFNTTTGPYMQQITTYARSASTTGYPFYPIVFNPGQKADSRFFAYPDNIIMLEDAGSNTYDITTAITNIPTPERSNSSILFHDWAGLTATKQTAVVKQIIQADIAGFFMSTTGYNATNNDALWPAFVQSMNQYVQAQ